MSSYRLFDYDTFSFDIEPIYQALPQEQLFRAAFNENVDQGLDRHPLENDRQIYNVVDDVLDFNNQNPDVELGLNEQNPFQRAREDLAELQRNPFRIQLPQLALEAQQPLNNGKIFNNMPGFTIGAIHSLSGDINLNGILIDDFENLHQIERCFRRLKHQVLLKLSSKVGKRDHLRMLLNNVDPALNQELRRSATAVEAKYFELLETFGEEIMNEAKQCLRQVISGLMTRRWMSLNAQGRQFKSKIEQRREVFEKYLNHFRRSLLDDDEVPKSVVKSQVLRIPLFNLDE